MQLCILAVFLAMVSMEMSPVDFAIQILEVVSVSVVVLITLILGAGKLSSFLPDDFLRKHPLLQKLAHSETMQFVRMTGIQERLDSIERKIERSVVIARMVPQDKGVSSDDQAYLQWILSQEGVIADQGSAKPIEPGMIEIRYLVNLFDLCLLDPGVSERLSSILAKLVWEVIETQAKQRKATVSRLVFPFTNNTIRIIAHPLVEKLENSVRPIFIHLRGKEVILQGDTAAGREAALIADVVTSGEELLEYASAVKDAGLTLNFIVALIERTEGGAEKAS